MLEVIRLLPALLLCLWQTRLWVRWSLVLHLEAVLRFGYGAQLANLTGPLWGGPSPAERGA